MPPALSFVATLALLGAALTLLHWISLWLELPDIVALLLFALPLSFYFAYCTESTRARVLRIGLRYFLVFASVVLASAGLVLFIGN